MREFNYFVNHYTAKKSLADVTCKNCLSDVRNDIIILFKYFDCDNSKVLSAEEIYEGVFIHFNYLIQFKNVNTEFPITTTMVNDFVLKSMELNTSELDRRDFVYSILMGLMERHIPKDKIDNG